MHVVKIRKCIIEIKQIYLWPYNWYIKKLYWSKVLIDQQGLCQFFRKHKIVTKLETATIKQVIIHLSNLLKCFFKKRQYVFIFGQKIESTLPKSRLQFHNLIIPFIGHSRSHFLPLDLNGKSVDLLVSEFFLCRDLSVIMFSLKGKEFRFPPVCSISIQCMVD